MSESVLLSLLLRYPHPVAIARRVRTPVLQDGIRRLEHRGLVRRRGGVYRVTKRGRAALEFEDALAAVVRRALT
jgi:hypothetical protein